MRDVSMHQLESSADMGTASADSHDLCRALAYLAPALPSRVSRVELKAWGAQPSLEPTVLKKPAL